MTAFASAVVSCARRRSLTRPAGKALLLYRAVPAALVGLRVTSTTAQRKSSYPVDLRLSHISS